MQRWRGQDEIPTDWGRCVLTIGVFDGVHRGHAELIAHAVKAGRARGVPAVLMTFDPHPMEVVYPGSHPAQLTTLTRRAELVQDLGIEVFLVMPFTTDFMKLTPDRFIHELLVEHLHVVEVVVGENFTFGKKAAGNVDTLRRAGERFGFAVESMSLVSEHHSNETVTFSSTYIRSCVDAGDMVAAMEALGRPHRVEGVVVRGEGRGAELGFPTANVAPPMYSAIPADGVYAAWFTVLGHGPVTGTVVPGERYQAAVSVGTNPTFSGRTRTVEAFVLDTTADLYGQHVALDFVGRIRGQKKFESVRQLVAAMGADTERARDLLCWTPPLTSTVNMWPWTSSGVSAARRSSNRCASWSLRWVPIPSGHVTCCAGHHR
ncbi:bifunctional FAD synthetase/riboflavin biosynthesis protein RibF [Mycobacterium tuberculosis variant bovis B2 7505]|nr:bifunctional FAD synthetase/riboflavin biosynthesis protein RibF [Mycobacterium tuberculosis variant bovis B2 7505]